MSRVVHLSAPDERELRTMYDYGFYKLGAARKCCVVFMGLYRRGVLRKDLLRWMTQTWIWPSRWKVFTWESANKKLANGGL